MCIDVGLGFTIHEVESEATGNLFKVNIGSSSCIDGGCKIVAAHRACKVENLTDLVLCKVELVSSTLCRSLNVNRNIEIRYRNGEFNLVGFGVGNSIGAFANGESYGEGKSNSLFTKLDGNLTVFADGEVGVVNRPCKGNVIEVLTCNRKLENGVCIDCRRQLDCFKLGSDLLSRGLFYILKILEGSGVLRNEVGGAVVENKDTGYVCRPAELFCVLGIDLVLVSIVGCCVAHIVGEVGNVGSYVCLLAVQLEVEVLAGAAELLSADGNALEGYGKTNIVLKLAAACPNGGKILSCGKLLLGGIGDLEGTALKLLHAGVRLNGGGNGNGHTKLNALGNGVGVELVAVVTALALKVCKEEVVTGVALGLGVHHYDDTLNSHGVALCCCHVLFEGCYGVRGNGAGTGVGRGGVIACLDGSGESVGNFNGSLLVEVYVCHTVGANGDGDALDICRPGNFVGVVAYGKLRGKIIVIGGNGGFALEVRIEVILCAFEIVLDGGLIVLVVFIGGASGEASREGESGDAKNCDQEKC